MGENYLDLAKNVDISNLKHSFHESRSFIRNATESVPDVIFQFCFHPQ